VTRRNLALLAGSIFAASCTLSSEGTAPSPAASGTGGGSSTSGSGGATSTSTSTSGGGGAMPCTPGQQIPCYDGPAGTEGVGSCLGGLQTCDASGAGFGPCEGQVTPSAEDCAAPGDEDCSGQPNDNCACDPGSTVACYSGAAGTSGVGPCHDGTQICEADGLGYGPCTGEVTPATETCDGQLIDENCDGATNEGTGSGCICDGGATAACYTGPAGTLGVGICTGGLAQCNPEGTALGPCNGEVVPTFDTCATAADEDCDASAVVCTGSTVWGARFGDDSDQIANDVGTYGSAAYVTGEFKGTLNFGGGALDAGSTSKDDIFVTKLDAAGAPLWAKRYGVSGTDEQGNALDVSAAGSVAVTGSVASPTQFDPNGGVLPAGGKDDLFVLVLDANGAYVWANIFGDSGGDQVGRGVTFDGAGSLYVAGSLQGSIDFNGQANDFSGGGNDAFLAKVSAADGTASWVQAYGGAMEQLAYGVAIDPAGNPVLVGRADGTMDFGGTTILSAGKSDAFVAKLKASDGTPIWARRVGGTEADLAYAVTVDAAGSIYVGGFFNGTNVDFGGGVFFNSLLGDAFVLKLDGNGNTLWAKQYGAAGPQEVRSLAIDALGNLLVTGFFQNGVDFGGGVLTSGGANDNVFVLKLDPSGNHIWSKGYGDTASQRAFGIASDNQANAFVVGQFSNTIDFGNGALTSSSGSIDVFVAKLAP
jgi:protein involved in ribonucleotide reduction